jgi:hypothetical protein
MIFNTYSLLLYPYFVSRVDYCLQSESFVVVSRSNFTRILNGVAPWLQRYVLHLYAPVLPFPFCPLALHLVRIASPLVLGFAVLRLVLDSLQIRT